MRDWKSLKNDEIFAFWKSYLRTEFPSYGDPLHTCPVLDKPFRLTPMEIIRLVEELIERLEKKDNDET